MVLSSFRECNLIPLLAIFDFPFLVEEVGGIRYQSGEALLNLYVLWSFHNMCKGHKKAIDRGWKFGVATEWN